MSTTSDQHQLTSGLHLDHNLDQKILTRKTFLPENFFYPKNFLTQKFFWPENLLNPKKFLTQNFFWSKAFWTAFFDLKFFSPNNFLYISKMFNKQFIWFIECFLPQKNITPTKNRFINPKPIYPTYGMNVFKDDCNSRHKVKVKWLELKYSTSLVDSRI